MKKILAGSLLTLLLMVCPVLAVSVDVGTHYLEPNTPGQSFQLWMTTPSAEMLGVVILELQVGDGGPPIGQVPGPAISNVDLFTGTVLGAHPNWGELGFGSYVPQMYQAATASDWTPEQPYDPAHPEILPPEYLADGLLATVTIDTTGFASGSWQMLVSQTVAGASSMLHSDLAPLPLTITDGNLTIVSTTLNSATSGAFNVGGTWDGGGQVPGAGLKTSVGSHTVTVAANDAAFALSIGQADGKVVVNAGQTLALGSISSADLAEGTLDLRGTVQAAGSVHVNAGKLDLAPTGRLNVGTTATLGNAAEYINRINAADNGLIAAAGNIALDGKLTLAADSILKPAGEYGDVPARTIVTAAAGVGGMFATDPGVGADLGHGVINKGVVYEPNAVKVDLFQAGPGDTWNVTTNAAGPDRIVDVPDIQQILRANKFNKPEPAVWNEGDFTDDGFVKAEDIQKMLQANLFKKGTYGAGREPSAISAEAPSVALIVTSEGLLIDTNGTTVNGYILSSKTGILTGDAANNLGIFIEDTDNAISGQMFFALNGTHLLGDVLGEGAAGVDLGQDLSMTYTVQGQSSVYQATLVVPEPSTVGLLLSGALLALLLRRRRRTK